MSELKVRDLMTDSVIAVRQTDDLATLWDLMMDHNIRHIPVVDKDRDLVGLVSHRDLLRNALIERQDIGLPVEQAVLESLSVQELMTRNVETVNAETDVRDAAQVMFENKYGCLPVTDGPRLVGMLTEADFVRFMAHGE